MQFVCVDFGQSDLIWKQFSAEWASERNERPKTVENAGRVAIPPRARAISTVDGTDQRWAGEETASYA